jgi:hypothetical protein
MNARPTHSALLVLCLIAGSAGSALAQAMPSTSFDHCVLAVSPSPDRVCEARVLTFDFSGARAADPMDASAPHSLMVGTTAMLPFLTTESTSIASLPVDPVLDPETTGSITTQQD